MPRKRTLKLISLLICFFSLLNRPIRADSIQFDPPHYIHGIRLDWVDMLHITWMEKVGHDRWIATLGLQDLSNKRPPYNIEFPDENTRDRPLGSYLMVVLINNGGRVLMRSQHLIPGAEFIGAHYARVKIVDPANTDDDCAYIVTPDFQRFYCFNAFLELLHHYRLPQRVLDFAIIPTSDGKPALLVIQKRENGWLHLLDPKSGKTLRSWLTTVELKAALPKTIGRKQYKKILSFLEDPEVDVMELPEVALMTAPPFITVIVMRGANFAFIADADNLHALRVFSVSIPPQPVKVLRGPAFFLINAFLSRSGKPNHQKILVFGAINTLTRVADLSNIDIGYFTIAKKRYRSLKHITIASVPSLLELDLNTGRTKWLKIGLFATDADHFYYPILFTRKKQNRLYGLVNVFDLQHPYPFKSAFSSVTLH